MPDHALIPEAFQPLIRRTIRDGFVIASCIYLAAWTLLLTNAPIALRVTALVVAVSIVILRGERTRRKLGLPITKHPILPRPHNRLYEATRIATGLSLFGLFQTTLEDPIRSTGAASAVLAALPFVMVGLWLIRIGSSVREATPPSCPHCLYPVADLPFPLTCPECAEHMPSSADAVTTPLVKRPVLTWTGYAACVLSLVIFVSILIRPGGVFAAMPLPARLALAPTDSKAFATINTAALSTEERDRLIARILDARANGSTLRMHRQLGWLGDELIAGNLTDAQAHRLTREHWNITITTDRPLRSAQTAYLTIAGQSPAHHPRTLDYRYATLGFEIDAETIPRIDNFHASFPASSLRHHVSDHNAASGEKPLLRIRPSQSGTMQARIRIIRFVIPADTPHTVVWNPDGSCTITPPPLDMHEIILETTLTVTP